MTSGKIMASMLVLVAVLAGLAVWYLQVYGFYEDVDEITGASQMMVTLPDGATRPVTVSEFKGIDAESSPIRWRACFTLDPAEVADPVTAGVRHLAAGGDLVVLPEGTSEWSHAPQPYRKGAARILAVCRAQGVDVEVVPVGLFYSAPDRYRSRVEVLLADPVRLPDDGTSASDAASPDPSRVPGPGAGGAPAPAEVDRIHQALSTALGAVSVDCPDDQSFHAVLAAAGADARAAEAFTESFLHHQRQARAGRPPLPGAPAPRWPRVLGLTLQAPIAPVLLTACAVGKKADAVNTVSFFRVLGGTGAALLWAPVLAGLTVAKPAAGAAALASTAAGWALLGVNRWRL